MTRKDFGAIAAAIRHASINEGLVSKPLLIWHLCRYLEERCPNFDGVRFARACLSQTTAAEDKRAS